MRISDWSSDVCSSDLGVGPAVEAAFAYRGEVVGHQVGAEFVALVDRCPQHAGAGLDGQRRGIAQAAGVGPVHPGLGIDMPHLGAIKYGVHSERWEERRGGNECVCTSRYRWGQAT